MCSYCHVYVFLLCSVYSVLCSVYSVLCSVYSVLCSVHSVLCSVYSVLCSVYSVLCSVYSVFIVPTDILRLHRLEANARVYIAKTGHGPLSFLISELCCYMYHFASVMCSCMYFLFVLFYVLFVCKYVCTIATGWQPNCS